MADEYDEALAFLREQDKKAGRGTYFEAVAGLIEKLLGRVFELEQRYEPKPDPAHDAYWARRDDLASKAAKMHIERQQKARLRRQAKGDPN